MLINAKCLITNHKLIYHVFQSDEVYLEAGIQNITTGPIFLEKVDLEPSSCYVGMKLLIYLLVSKTNIEIWN